MPPLTVRFVSPGIAAATIFSPSKDLEVSENQLRVAFDGDAVLFSDESEQIVKAHGLDMFFEHEKAHENKPLAQVALGVLARCSQKRLRGRGSPQGRLHHGERDGAGGLALPGWGCGMALAAPRCHFWGAVGTRAWPACPALVGLGAGSRGRHGGLGVTAAPCSGRAP